MFHGAGSKDTRTGTPDAPIECQPGVVLSEYTHDSETSARLLV